MSVRKTPIASPRPKFVSHVGAPLLLGALVWLAALAAGYFLRRRQAPDQT